MKYHTFLSVVNSSGLEYQNLLKR